MHRTAPTPAAARTPATAAAHVSTSAPEPAPDTYNNHHAG
jgi:hypothetical protein